MANLNWNNLKLNKCPNCGKEFGALNFMTPGYITCVNSFKNCTFKISEKRCREIITSKITAELEQKWNQEEEGGINL